MHIKINAKNIALYAAYTIILICINHAVSGVPLSLGLCFAMLICGTNIIATPALYIIASIANINLYYSLLALYEGTFLALVTFIYRKTHKKIKAEGGAYMCIALAPFVAFSPFQGSGILAFGGSVYVERAIAAIIITIFALFCFKGVYALFYRLFRCKLRTDELLCLAVIYTLFGAGLFNLCGRYAFTCICISAVIFFARLYKNPTVVIYSAVIFLPLVIMMRDINYLTAGLILSVILLLFVTSNKFVMVAVGIITSSAYFYFIGSFDEQTVTIVIRALTLLILCILPVLPSDKKLAEQLNLINVTSVVNQTLEERIKQVTSEKLFRLSEVFREIECAFEKMDDDLDMNALKRGMLRDCKEELCKSCQRYEKCVGTGVYRGYEKLIDRGCVKGRVSLVDLPSDVTTQCVKPADAIEKLNRLLADYRRYTIEAENMKSGRKLLANQAKGISEVLKNCGVEFCKVKQDYSRLENIIKSSLSERGISCVDVRIIGQDNYEIYLSVVGKVKIATIKDTLKTSTGKQFILKDKVIYDSEKSCLIFSAPSEYEAAFGVAYAVKDGEKSSGDTHSVININEHSFLMALSDGMGSGDYAKKVSSAAISLIEAFYRAEMPESIVLDTINKLICFNRDERFTCIDIAAINLNTLQASFIKIGSPAGIIARKGEIKILESNSLPLGILDSIHPTVCTEQLRDGDIVVFMSDGITSAFPSSTELYEFLSSQNAYPSQPVATHTAYGKQNLSSQPTRTSQNFSSQTTRTSQNLTSQNSHNPQDLAERILNGALSLTGKPTDDMTVLCTRIYKRPTE